MLVVVVVVAVLEAVDSIQEVVGAMILVVEVDAAVVAVLRSVAGVLVVRPES